jgi:hypothetical protein
MEVLSSLLYRFKAQQLGFTVHVQDYNIGTNGERRGVTHIWNADPEMLKAKLYEWMASLGTYSFRSGLNLFKGLTLSQWGGLGKHAEALMGVSRLCVELECFFPDEADYALLDHILKGDAK